MELSFYNFIRSHHQSLLTHKISIDVSSSYLPRECGSKFFMGGPDEIEKMISCEISKFLLYKSQKDGPSQFRTPWLYQSTFRLAGRFDWDGTYLEIKEQDVCLGGVYILVVLQCFWIAVGKQQITVNCRRQNGNEMTKIT